ncbi:multiple sugar transport system substrate-binding protein/raffinose/stachyose/melibiose transport system substrate-binding protein [Microbacterium ginsengiterrae]|uniref:Multiple sugar transport system substrate-binding protein/raffinose/stachyose/melibiose transport system substrate-binding protein n=1 Tax=Microbacterium ginsengiterrae TaxID=546115 RepID=A0A7W9CDD6_9MICO|nr:extracellular solute-binding protein [Microbacterium ginsengiterrae]MBB5743528.1 multiple sugar transport system substrate-binding protein/raffinose/stachyose/melibiose transport system substrate-binding protein [Microbacterium ginsengiterrae]
MKTRNARAAAAAVAGLMVLGLAACSGGSNGSSGADENGETTLTMWHNSTTGPGKQYWEDAAAAFHEENPEVTIKVTSIQNEDMDGKLQTAVNSGDMPDIFMARGGGKLADIVSAGAVKDLTDLVDDDVKAAFGDAPFSAFSVDGKIYGMPSAVLPGGIFYSKDLFEEAGISGEPTTIAELEDAVDKLKAAGIEPIALGAKDAWPAAHWYYFFAVRACGEDLISNLATNPDFSDECWLTAAENLSDFVAIEPFNSGFLTTSAQEGANSSAGLVANHKAAMELMGAWDVGVIAGLTPDEQPLPDLGWFPFPEVEGGEGAPGAMMGGVDGYSCSANSPESCEQFLNFISSKEWQENYAEAFQTVPASQDALGAVTDPSLIPLMEAYSNAPYVALWLDTALGQNVGNALNTGVVEMLAGQGDPEKLVANISNAAARG